MTYNKPELMLVGAARTLVLGGQPIPLKYDNAVRILDETDALVW
jgi:hypothetical protein